MKPFILTLIALIYGIQFSYAQREADNWYFGDHAGISFRSGSPVALTDGQFYQSEGVATISDPNGNLLFYTEGSTIWTRNHTTMQNGTGLNGDGLSAQAGVIVPMPNNPDIYYVFTTSNWPNSGITTGLYYSVVDMRLNNGFGAVTVKNQLLNANVREQVTSAYHSNCHDVWIVTHEKGNSNNFLTYLLTPAGLQTTPVISSIGMNYAGGNRYGYLRFSSNGNKLCTTLGYANTSPNATITVQLFDFDKATGILSNPITIGNATTTLRDAYSSEFSADNTKLYVVAYNGTFIYQYDLSSGNPATIAASGINVATGAGAKTCLQMGPDKKIYVSRVGQEYLGVINKPDLRGAACNYVNDGVWLNGKTGTLGLPNFMQGFFSLPYLGVDTGICPGGSLLLNAYTRPGDTYQWQDGSVNPTYTVTQTGQYWVEVNNNGCVKRDEIQVIANPLPVVHLGNDTILCRNATLLLDPSASGAGSTYAWQDGATTATYAVSQPGDYWVKVTEDGCSNGDTISVSPMPPISLGKDVTVCDNQTLLLQTVTVAGSTYTWQDGSTQPAFTVTRPGTYSVNVSSPCGLFSDVVVVKFEDCSCKINIPNAFTPNHDNRNDIFKPVITHCDFAEYNLKIFNRWGEKIFETGNPSMGWDGSYKGHRSDIGGYVYVVTYRSNTNTDKKVKHGTLMLVR